jgi:hypothetical protein
MVGGAVRRAITDANDRLKRVVRLGRCLDRQKYRRALRKLHGLLRLKGTLGIDGFDINGRLNSPCAWSFVRCHLSPVNADSAAQ